MNDLGFEIAFPYSNRVRKLYLELTGRCNLNCSICYRQGWDTVPQDMDSRTLEAVFRSLQEIAGLETIVLGGIGEPAGYPELSETMRRLSGYNLLMTTNGTLFSPGTVRDMIRYLDGVTVSVDGDRETYEAIRGTSYDQVVEGMRRLQQEKRRQNSQTPRLELQFVASRENIDSIFSVMDLAVELQASRLVVSNLIPQNESQKDSILYTPCLTEENRRLQAEIQRYAFRRGLQVQLPPLEMKTERNCRFVEDVSAYITWDGDVVPCYRFAHPSREYVFGRPKKVRRYSFGNILEESLTRIWNRDSYRKFRYKIYANRYPSCLDCDLLEGCDLPTVIGEDCFGNAPGCSDCLWSRRLVVCP